jgi:glucosyl-dolichyl phosphate glucuronosyltransferase
LDLSTAPMVLNDYQYLYGGNIAFPRVVLENFGGFTSVFGRNGSKLLSNEELFLQRRLRERGDYCYYHPEILVGHHVAASRLSKRWFFRRAYWQGVSDAVLRLQQEKPSPLKRLWMGVSVVRQQLVSRRKLLALSVPSHSPDDFALKFFVISKFGYVLGLWGLTR